MDEMLMVYLYFCVGTIACLVLTIIFGFLSYHAPFGEMTLTILFMVFIVIDFLALASLLTLGILYLILAVPTLIGG